MATVDGNPPNPGMTNVVVEVQGDTLITPSKIVADHITGELSLEPVTVQNLDNYIKRGRVSAKWKVTTPKRFYRYTDAQLKKQVRELEFPVLEAEIANQMYAPVKGEPGTWKFGTYGYGITHPKGSFVGNRIKIGAGISKPEPKPAYREFGKYIIHSKNLEEGVLNPKYPSGASIPALKPVNVSDNYKEFISDILEGGGLTRTSEKHFNSLTAPEQSHFVKLIRGAGLKIPLTGKDEAAESTRFEILSGEWEAGNDNVKLVAELKTLLCKFIEDGRINKKKGLEMLFNLANA